MCGIAGEVSLGRDSVVDTGSASRMLRALAHRGPDGWGVYVDPSRRAMLLHARLSIIDLEGGAQPLGNEDGTVWASVNGEIYGFEELRRELTDRGHRFATGSDSEVVLHLYEEMGEEFPSRLRGEFAIAVWDERRQR